MRQGPASEGANLQRQLDDSYRRVLQADLWPLTPPTHTQAQAHTQDPNVYTEVVKAGESLVVKALAVPA